MMATVDAAPGEISEERFWSLIALVGDLGGPDDAYEQLIERLADGRADDIDGFEATLARMLFQLDTRRLGDVVLAWQRDGDYLSADLFLYLRCGIIARGRAAYERVLTDPEQAHSMLEWEQQDEGLLSVAGDARDRAGVDGPLSESAYDYETWSNEAGWA